jgi:anti-sigma factor ChrR (cupin superfamily)
MLQRGGMRGTVGAAMNTDLNSRVVVDTQSMEWLATTAVGERCKLLAGDAAAAASTTRMLECAPGATLATPAHGLGEEILVLEGTLADDRAGYSAGAYLRNPPGTQRSLRTSAGCVLFVKRYPFETTDTALVRIDTANTAWRQGLVPGLSVMPLHEHPYEHVALVRWQPETYFQPHGHFGGEEILVLSGVFEDEHGSYPAGTWIRSPHMSRHQPFSRPGCTIYVKTGHLLLD